MLEHLIDIPGRGPGTTHRLRVVGFGDPSARPHVHVQGGLHADEGPGMMAALCLIDALKTAETEGRIAGHVTVVPAANPFGLGQFLQGDQSGRFDLYDGRNFNRDYPDLVPVAAMLLDGALGDDAARNVSLVRAALRQALDARVAHGPTDTLRHHLMRLALGADLVLDLHCDGEAEVHLYTQPASLPALHPYIALAACRAVLLADNSGGNPFDEAVSRPWAEIAAAFPSHPLPPSCASCTVELRGRSDVCRDLGATDAQAITDYLTCLGVLRGPRPDLPEPACTPTPLAGSEALTAPVAGLLSYRVAVGRTVTKGEIVAEITDLQDGTVTPVRAGTSGVFYARPATRIAETGKRLGKIAGAVPFRDGLLLSP